MNTEKKEPKIRLSALLYSVVAGLLLLMLALLVFLPVEWGGTKTRLLLWKAGARPVTWEKHSGFTQDRCDGKAPEECLCVWLVHGLGDSISTWRETFTHKKSFGKLPVRLFAIDLPAHGASPKRQNMEEYRVRTMAHELNNEIGKTAECKRNAVIGNSFGGWVATRMALDEPLKYEKLVLIAPSGMEKIQPPRETNIEELFSTPTIESLKEFQRRAYHKPRNLPDSAWKIAVKRIQESESGEVRKAQRPEDSLDADLTELKVPAVIIWGESDRILPKREMDAFIEKSPSTKFHPIPECGHLPQKECPEKLYPLIMNALSEGMAGG